MYGCTRSFFFVPIELCRLHQNLVLLNVCRASSWVRLWGLRLIRATNCPMDASLRRSMLVVLCDHWCLLRPVLFERWTCTCSKILCDGCEFTIHTESQDVQRNVDSLLVRRCDLVLISCTAVLRVRPDTSQISSCFDALVRISNHVTKFPGLYLRECPDHSRPQFGPRRCSIVFSNLTSVSENILCCLRKRLQIAITSLCFRHKSPESFFHRNDGSLFGGAAFTGISCFLNDDLFFLVTWFWYFRQVCTSSPLAVRLLVLLFVARAGSLLPVRISFTREGALCFFGNELLQIE